MRKIAVVNQKGGCGKTTVSINLASALADAGKKTLLVDMDSQSHCAVGLAVPEEQIEQSIYDIMVSKSKDEPTRLREILWQITDNLELAPSSIDLSAFEQQMMGVQERENLLKKVLNEVESDFDYAIIDCPPAVGIQTFNALKAADEVIVPVETGYFALHGLSRQLETLSILCQRSKQKTEVRILASMYDIRTKMAREVLAELRNHFGDKMFKTIVNFNTKLKEAASYGQPINEYAPASKGQKDFSALASELVKTEQTRHRLKADVESLAGQLESISKTADELLQSSNVPVKNIQQQRTEELISENRQDEHISSITEKLSDYYGVNQFGDAIVFVSLYPRAEKVQIAGDFNNWQPGKTEMEKVGESGVWQARIKIPQGRHKYRMVVDGKWQQDPYNEHTEPNPFGELNSIVEVH
jgi:chromosome partitioning protein